MRLSWTDHEEEAGIDPRCRGKKKKKPIEERLDRQMGLKRKVIWAMGAGGFNQGVWSEAFWGKVFLRTERKKLPLVLIKT